MKTKNIQTKQRRGFQKTETKIILPTELTQAIEGLKLPAAMTEKAIDIAARIIYKKGVGTYVNVEYIPLSVSYLRQVYGSNYLTGFLNAMKENQIILTNNSFAYGHEEMRGKCKGYKINPKFLQEGSLEGHCSQNIPEKNADKENIPVNRTFFPESLTTSGLPIYSFSFPVNLLKTDLASLKYDIDKIACLADDHVKSITRDSFKTGDQIEKDSFEVQNIILGRKYYTTKGQAIAWASWNQCTLIEDKSSYYIDDLNKFVEKKKRDWRVSFTTSLNRLEKKVYNVSRNIGNNRIYHDLTSLWQVAIEQIKSDNDLVEITQCNSLFAIHAQWLRSENINKLEGDVLNYVNLCEGGQFYDELAKILCVDKSKVEKMMLKLIYSHQRYSSTGKKLFKQHFPNVLNHMEAFKKQNVLTRGPYGHKEFALKLQRKEAEILIDNLYPSIKEQGLFCLPMHDSIIVRRVDETTVRKIMAECFHHFDFKVSY